MAEILIWAYLIGWAVSALAVAVWAVVQNEEDDPHTIVDTWPMVVLVTVGAIASGFTWPLVALGGAVVLLAKHIVKKAKENEDAKR